jgi:hypothetical protein
MRHRKGGMVLAGLKALIIVLIVGTVFTVVGLRSNVMSLEYSLSTLEKSRTEALRDQKVLAADKAALMSLKRVDRVDYAGSGFSFPERKKVVYVRDSERGPVRTAYSRQ